MWYPLHGPSIHHTAMYGAFWGQIGQARQLVRVARDQEAPGEDGGIVVGVCAMPRGLDGGRALSSPQSKKVL